MQGFTRVGELVCLVHFSCGDLRGLSVAGRSLLVADDKMRCVHELRRETSAEQAQREALCREVDDPVARNLGSLHL